MKLGKFEEQIIQRIEAKEISIEKAAKDYRIPIERLRRV